MGDTGNGVFGVCEFSVWLTFNPKSLAKLYVILQFKPVCMCWRCTKECECQRYLFVGTKSGECGLQ